MNSNQNDERELFSRISQEDDQAYRQLFTNYFDRLKWYAFKLLKSEFWAEEIVQEVFIHLWEARHHLPSVENPSAYLYRMVGNRCFDRIRRQDLEIEMQYVAYVAVHGTQQYASQPGQYDLQRVEGYLKEVVAGLPDQRRVIYKLQQEKGLSYQEIADQLNISRHTVRNQMAKTLHTIREYLLKKGTLYLLLFSHFYFL